MNVDNVQASRKRRHPDSSESYSIVQKTSSELLKLIENPNFLELSRRSPAFQKAWNETKQTQRESKSRKSFSSCVSQEFTISLTRALLQIYFGLKLPHLESDHLCPPVPNRFFYLHWIQSHLLVNEQERSNVGMDIGTGATCIYPLLASRFFHLTMVASDIDDNALALAEANVISNQMENKILLLKVDPSHSQHHSPSLPNGGPIDRTLRVFQNNNKGFVLNRPFDFIMCNPPFYDPNDEEHINTPRIGDGRNRTSMTVSEGNYPNGEIGFVTDMIVDSLQARQSSLWFSSMLGKKTSLVKLEKLLTHILGPAHVDTTEYGPGQYTRWFIAWTLRQPNIFSPTARVKYQQPETHFEVRLEGLSNPELAVKEVMSRIDAFCHSAPGGWGLTTERGTEISITSSRMLIKEASFTPITLHVDESDIILPPVIINALQGKDNTNFLPKEGHFAIQVLVEATKVTNTPPTVITNVLLDCYRHSSRGLKAIQKITSGMKGEVTRTNRKWRRFRKNAR